MDGIEYERTVDDYVACQLFTFNKSTVAKHWVKFQRYLFPILFMIMWTAVLILSIILAFDTVFIVLLIALPTISIIWIFMIPIYYRWSIKSKTKQLLTSGDNKIHLGKCVTTINTESIVGVRSTDYIESRLKWSGVIEIGVNDDYIFFYISSNDAIFIPKRAFSDEADFASFIETAKQHKKNSANQHN